MSWCLSQGSLFCWKRTCGQNPSTEAFRDGRVSEWRWWLRRDHRTRGLVRFVRIDRGERRKRALCDGRAAAAPLALQLVGHFVYTLVREGKHINLLESLISLLRRVAREAVCGWRLLVVVDSRVVLGAVSEGRSNSRKINFSVRKPGCLCLAYDIALELIWVPTWANRAEIHLHGVNCLKAGMLYFRTTVGGCPCSKRTCA